MWALKQMAWETEVFTSWCTWPRRTRPSEGTESAGLSEIMAAFKHTIKPTHINKKGCSSFTHRLGRWMNVLHNRQTGAAGTLFSLVTCGPTPAGVTLREIRPERETGRKKNKSPPASYSRLLAKNYWRISWKHLRLQGFFFFFLSRFAFPFPPRLFSDQMSPKGLHKRAREPSQQERRNTGFSGFP